MEAPGSAPNVTHGDVRGVFARLEQPSTPMTAADVAETLGCEPQPVRESLADLAERGELETRLIDEETRVWWRPTGGHARDGEAFGAFVDAVRDYAIFVLDPDGTVVSWNEGANRLKGYEAEEIVGEHVSTFYTDDDVADGVPERNLEQARRNGRVEDEGWRVRADGTRFFANVVVTAIRDDDGDLEGFTKVTRDVTERRAYERRLHRESEQTEKLLRTAPIAIAVQNAAGETILANRRAQEALGLSEQEIIDEPNDAEEWDLYDENGNPLDANETPTARVLATGDPVFDDEIVFDKPDGDRLHFRVNAAPVLDQEGAIERVVTTGEDITELKARERELEARKSELETELSEVFDRVSDAFYALDDEWRFTHLNEYAAEILGQSAEGFLGREVWEVFPEARDGKFWEQFHAAMETQEPVSFDFYADDFDAWLEFNVYPSESGLSIYFHDVSDRKRLEAELRESERRYRTLVEHFPNGNVALVDAEGRYRTVGGTLLDIAAAPETELEGEPVADVLPPTLAGKLAPAYDAALEGESSTFETDVDDHSFQFHVVPVRDDDGEVFAALGMSQDVTARREYERKLEESNERLEQFAYAASHDLQEPLRMVSSYLQLIDSRYGEELEADGREFLAFAVDGAERMREMIDGLLEYSRIETQGDPFEPVELDTVLADVREDLQVQIDEHDAEIVTESLPRVEGDRTQLRQVFQNLLDNAIEYSGDEPPDVRVTAERSDSMWQVSVRDHGIGIDPEESASIFEVFRRLHTRDEHAGTGIGLAICRRIVERHGGRIWAESAPGEGATFRFTLPPADDE